MCLVSLHMLHVRISQILDPLMFSPNIRRMIRTRKARSRLIGPLIGQSVSGDIIITQGLDANGLEFLVTRIG